MKHIQESIKELSKEVKSLRTEVSKGKGAISYYFYGALIVGLNKGFFKLELPKKKSSLLNKEPHETRSKFKDFYINKQK